MGTTTVAVICAVAQRRLTARKALLEPSNVLLLSQAIRTFGSLDNAVSGLVEPDFACGGQPLIDLLDKPNGIATILSSLIRIDHGVYY